MVEDDPASREVIEYLLERCEAEVTAVDDACAALAEFLRRWTDGPFDFVVSDLALPRMTGLELIRQLRAAERGSGAAGRVPAVALSAFARDRDRAEAMSAGFDAYLGKPVGAKLLVKTVTELLKPSAGNV